MKRKISLFLLIFIIAIFIISPENAKAASSVRVSLPTFNVSLNGVSIENSYRQYPLLLYKNITYFPMTYFDSRFMGLESIWDGSRGLQIVKTGANWNYEKYESTIKNQSSYYAQIAPFEISVNGKTIDNSREEYPLLLFRNVTYFPLTWRFAVDEFSWEYSFNQNDGLRINSTDKVPSASQITLPIMTHENGEKGAFTMAGDYFYYEGANGIIYQAPVSNPSNAKNVYQLPEPFTTFAATLTSLRTEDGRALLSYHTGGATMGSDHLIWLKDDGSYEVLDSGYSLMKIYDDYTIRVDQRGPFFVDNLQIKEKGERDYINIGKGDYSYGMHIREYGENKSRVASPSKDLYLIDDNIYLLAYYGYFLEDIEDVTTGIYRVNIETNDQVRLCDNEVATFKIINDTIYFVDENQYLYKVPLTGGKAELLVGQPVDLFEILGDKIYYSLKEESNQLYLYGQEKSVNPGGIVNSLEVQEGYIVAIFDKESQSQYKLMIFNNQGKTLYKSIENVLLVRIENGKVVFVKDK